MSTKRGLFLIVASTVVIPGIGLESRATAQQVGRLDVVEATIADVQRALQERRITCRELVLAYLQRIDAYDKKGPALNAVQTVNPAAVQEAERLDREFAAKGPVGPLHCVPLVVKDQLETRDMPTTFGSVLFAGFRSGRDATVVSRLRAAGAIVIAKTTMGEFASGYLGSAFGVVRNAYAPDRMPSGSSGGTGSSVAASFATAGIAEDTGGSTRGPASVHSLVGLRPTVPLVSRFGLLPGRPSQDTVGPIGRTVRDVAMVLGVIAGYDPNDPATAESVGHVAASYTATLTPDGLRGKRIGVVRAPLSPTTDTTTPDYRRVRAVIDRAFSDLRRLGADVVDPPVVPDLASRSSAIFRDNRHEREAATNAYLGGLAAPPFKTLADILMSGRVLPGRARQMVTNLGRSTSDPAFARLMLAREQLRREVLAAMADARLDAFAYATYDAPPPLIPVDALSRADIDSEGPGFNALLSSVIAFPAITVPAGFTDDGLPVGLELMARPFQESMLLTLAHAFEQGTRHRRPPPTTPPLAGGAGAR